jgi:hypothetical protein
MVVDIIDGYKRIQGMGLLYNKQRRPQIMLRNGINPKFNVYYRDYIVIIS